jgi:hypothetical protein
MAKQRGVLYFLLFIFTSFIAFSGEAEAQTKGTRLSIATGGTGGVYYFYYSILSEVSPPTALSPFAAAALTGGDPYKTTMQAWKYTLPAFLVPFNFTLHITGLGLVGLAIFSQKVFRKND